MNKVLKNIEKWILLVILSYLVVFALVILIENEIGLINSIGVMKYTDNITEVPTEDLLEIVKSNEEIFKEAISNNSNQEESNIKQAMQQYPMGTYIFAAELAQLNSISHINIQSLITGLIIGTGIYLLIDEKERKLLVYGIIYVLIIFLLGFIEGMMYTTGWTSIFECWIFPIIYFIPTTLMFGVLLCMIKIKQQGTIKELNKKLIEKKKEEPKVEDKENQTILERTKETREKIARIGMTISTLMIILALIITILFI